MTTSIFETQIVKTVVAAVYLGGENLSEEAGEIAQQIVVSRLRLSKNLLEPSDMAEVELVQQDGSSLWPLTQELGAALKTTPPTLVPIEFGLGYRSVETLHLPFIGHVHAAAPGHNGLTLRIEALDDKALHRELATKLEKTASPHDAVCWALDALGLTDYVVDLPKATMPHLISDAATAFDFFAQIRSTARIPFSWYFNPKGEFVWAPWNEADWTDAAEPVYSFLYQQNIVELTPTVSDLETEEETWLKETKNTSLDPTIQAYFANLPRGDVFDLVTIPQPWLWPGETIVVNHPLSEYTRFRLDGIVHEIGARSHLRIRGIS